MILLRICALSKKYGNSKYVLSICGNNWTYIIVHSVIPRRWQWLMNKFLLLLFFIPSWFDFYFLLLTLSCNFLYDGRIQAIVKKCISINLSQSERKLKLFCIKNITVDLIPKKFKLYVSDYRVFFQYKNVVMDLDIPSISMYGFMFIPYEKNSRCRRHNEFYDW